MLQKLEGRDKVTPHMIANKVNEVIEILNELISKTESKIKEENTERGK